MPSSKIRYNNIPVHYGVLNIAFFEARTELITRIADRVDKDIKRLRSVRLADRAIWWDRRIKNIDKDSYSENWDYFFHPKVYSLTGNFDVGALFFSPSLEMDAWVHQDALSHAGHDLNTCLLPDLRKSFLDDSTDKPVAQRILSESEIVRDTLTERLLSSDLDLNNRFIKSYADGEKRHRYDFLLVTKLKLNPAFWPEQHENANLEVGHLLEFLAMAWGAIDEWQQETQVGQGGGTAPVAALGISFGWNELICVAHSDSPGKLLPLALHLRQLGAPLPGREADDADNWSHLFFTSISVIGYDSTVAIEARRFYKDTLHGKADEEGKISATTLYNAAIKAPQSTFRPSLEGDIGPMIIQLGCYVYPGHEQAILSLFRDLESYLPRALDKKSAPSKAPSGENWAVETILDFGKRDVWAPRFLLGADESFLTPLAAATLRELVICWVLYGGRRKEEKSVPHAFDFYTRVGCPQEVLLPFLETINNNQEEGFCYSSHVKKDTENYALPFRDVVEKELEEVLTGFDPKVDSDDSKEPHLSRRGQLISLLKRSMRTLQIPYYLAEQVSNLIATFVWAHDRDIIWNESIELIPVVLALYEDLLAWEAWWEAGQPTASLPWGYYSEAERIRARKKQVNQQIAKYFAHDLSELLQNFRNYFYSRHLSHYLTDEMPDMNLRYHGSVHKMLSIASLILDALADQTLGSRACMAVIGDVASPQVTSPCNVLTVDLSTDAFRMPFMLESIAHEVGHELMIEAVREAADAGWRKGNAWVDRSSFESSEKQKSIDDFIQHVADFDRDVMGLALAKLVHQRGRFLGDLDLSATRNQEAALIIESVSDYVELLLMNYDHVEEWVPGFILRLTVAAPIEHCPAERTSEERKDVPAKLPSMFLFGLQRIVTVAIMERLAQLDTTPDLEEFRTSFCSGPALKLRKQLAKKVLGPWVVEEVIQRIGFMTANKESEGSWPEFLEEIFVGKPWFSSQDSFGKFHQMLRSLRAHVNEPNHESAEPARLLSSIRAAFSQFRADLEPILYPSVFVRHWLAGDELQDVRRDGEYSPGEDPPWRAFLNYEAQATGHNKVDEVDARVVMFQRGNMLFRHDDDQKQWFEITSRFLLRMQQMIPAWRRAILKKSQRVMSSSDCLLRSAREEK